MELKKLLNEFSRKPIWLESLTCTLRRCLAVSAEEGGREGNEREGGGGVGREGRERE